MRTVAAIFMLAFAVGLCVPLVAQDAKPADPPAVQVVPDPVDPKDQALFATLQIRGQVQAEMIQSLQKELDSTNANLSRLIAKLQEDGKYVVQQDDQGRLVRVPAGKK